LIARFRSCAADAIFLALLIFGIPGFRFLCVIDKAGIFVKTGVSTELCQVCLRFGCSILLERFAFWRLLRPVTKEAGCGLLGSVFVLGVAFQAGFRLGFSI